MFETAEVEVVKLNKININKDFLLYFYGGSNSRPHTCNTGSYACHWAKSQAVLSF